MADSAKPVLVTGASGFVGSAVARALLAQGRAVRVLLRHGADVNAADGMFAASPLVWAVEGLSNARRPRADYVEVASILIDAGSPVDWTPPEGAPGPERTLEGLSDLRQAVADRRRSP